MSEFNDDDEDIEEDEDYKVSSFEERMQEVKQQRAFDNASMTVGEGLPPLWWRMYSNLQTEGFTEPQSFELLKHFIAASYSSNIHHH